LQPLDGLGSDAIQIAPVMCHEWNSHAGWFSAIGLITAPNMIVESLRNLAAASGGAALSR
jgi:hypothetical protein